MRYAIEPMRLDDIPVVNAIERQSFTQPWPAHAYRKEIQQNRLAYYYVARRLDGPAFGPDELQVNNSVLDAENSLVGRFTRLFRTSPGTASLAPDADSIEVIGYGGIWLMSDEAHVTTIAVHPKYRGEGVGELLLVRMIDTAREIGARWLTLEVRKSNQVAQALYRKYTFKEMGVRHRYYGDNGEDALVMWTDPIDSESFSQALAENRSGLEARLKRDG